MCDHDLLARAATKQRPVLLTRHFGASVETFLSFAGYTAAEGNRNILLRERGIVQVGRGKSFTRYTLDLGAVAAIQKETFLPVIVDLSHAAGRRDLIFNMSCRAVASGACGSMIEVHCNPAEAPVDGQQNVTPHELRDAIEACDPVHYVLTADKGRVPANE